MKILPRIFIGGLVFLVGFAVLAILDLRERAQRRRLGAGYEGPLEARDDD